MCLKYSKPVLNNKLHSSEVQNHIHQSIILPLCTRSSSIDSLSLLKTATTRIKKSDNHNKRLERINRKIITETELKREMIEK